MPDRKYNGANYRFGFNGKENDNEVKGFGNQQDYGMRIFDARIGRFLSVDPITMEYPELTPYQFASNRPIDGIDRDGLEFVKFNDSYIKMRIDYDPKLKQVSATTYFRLDESQRDRWPARRILTGKVEEMIRNTPAQCDCIPNYDSRVSRIQFNFPTDNPEMSDATDLTKSASPEEFRTLRVPKNKSESREIERSKEFFTPGISGSISKWNARMAALEVTTMALEKAGIDYSNSIIREARGSQSRKAADVLILVQYSINNGTLDKFLNNGSLTQLSNYLLYGADIKDKELERIGKKIWQEYSGFKKLEKLIRHSDANQHNPVDNVGVKNHAGFEP